MEVSRAAGIIRAAWRKNMAKDLMGPLLEQLKTHGEPTILINPASPFNILKFKGDYILNFMNWCIELAHELQKNEGKISVMFEEAGAEFKWSGKNIAFLFLTHPIADVNLNYPNAVKIELGKLDQYEYRPKYLLNRDLILSGILKQRIADIKEAERLSQEAKKLHKKDIQDYLNTYSAQTDSKKHFSGFKE